MRCAGAALSSTAGQGQGETVAAALGGCGAPRFGHLYLSSWFATCFAPITASWIRLVIGPTNNSRVLETTYLCYKGICHPPTHPCSQPASQPPIHPSIQFFTQLVFSECLLCAGPYVRSSFCGKIASTAEDETYSLLPPPDPIWTYPPSH